MNEIRDLIVGIDFGKEYSQICYYDRKGEEARSLSMKAGGNQYEAPSCVCYRPEQKDYCVGLEAEYFAREKGGIMIDDEYEDSIVGTPQGGNLSPLLANIMLNELDKEMEKRGLNFVRYADDCIIMVGSEMSANRVMRNISRFIEKKLGLKVNMSKSKVDKPQGLKYLGFGFYFDSRAHQFKAKPHAKSVAKFKKRMKEFTCRSWGVSNSYKVEKLNQLIRGWINYFKIGNMKTLCKQLDSNIRYRLRMCIWKQWKTPQNRAKNLIKLGINKYTAWKVAYAGDRIAYVCNKGAVNVAISNERLTRFGLVSMMDYYAERCVTC